MPGGPGGGMAGQGEASGVREPGSGSPAASGPSWPATPGPAASAPQEGPEASGPPGPIAPGWPPLGAPPAMTAGPGEGGRVPPPEGPHASGPPGPIAPGWPALGQPGGGPGFGGGPNVSATPGEAPGEPSAPTTAMPTHGGYPPHWTPPASRPKKVPTAVKVVIGGVAAVALALCAGLTGAFVATSIGDNDFKIPLSTDTAPVVDRSTLSGVAAQTQPSVVSIATGSGEGSGVALSKDGYIVTNNHVVASARGDTVKVTLSDGTKVNAKVIGTDPPTDLAVIKADVDEDLKPAKFADSEKVKVGDTVLAIGSPLGLQGSVTSGIISALDRTIRAGEGNISLSGLIQTDAPINPGNSGGALVNTNGEVIGINTAIATGGGGNGNIGLGFAIPSNKAKEVAEQLINGEKVSHPFLGVTVSPAENGGATIESIKSGSPAEAAGLQTGDVITKFDDRVINDSNDLVSAVQSGTVGQKVTVEFIRNGEKKTATVTLGEAS